MEITLDSNTYLWMNDDTALLYNAALGRTKTIILSDIIREILDVLSRPESLYSVNVMGYGVDPGITSFVNMIVSEQFGTITCSDKHKISVPPKVRIIHDVANKAFMKSIDIDNDRILSYLSSLTFFVGGYSKHPEYYKQILYPVMTRNELSPRIIFGYVRKVCVQTINELNLVFSSSSEHIEDYVKSLSEFKEKLNLYFPFDVSADSVQTVICEVHNVTIICEMEELLHPSHRKKIDDLLALGCHMAAIIRSYGEFDFFDDIRKQVGPDAIDLIPVYDDNDEFFMQAVFLSAEDINNIKISKREIFIHQKVNPNFFGKIAVFPDLSVVANGFSKQKWSINDSIYDIIKDELLKGDSWLDTRKNDPCDSCLHQWLCPSPSVYEKAMNRNNACNFR